MDIPKGPAQADLVYKKVGNQEIMLTFLPPAQRLYEKAPVYVTICGGGWQEESRAKMLTSAAISIDRLRNQGFAVVSIDYRTWAVGNGIFMDHIVSDCFDALRYLAHFADILQIDPHRIATSGHSAGGHLALMIAYAPHQLFRTDSVLTDDFTVKVCAPLSPLTRTHGDLAKYTPIDMDSRLPPDTSVGAKDRWSPVAYVKADTPATVLAAGTADDLIFSRCSEELYEELQNVHVPCKLILSKGGGHCFEQVHDGVEPSVSKQQVHREIAEFILQHI